MNLLKVFIFCLLKISILSFSLFSQETVPQISFTFDDPVTDSATTPTGPDEYDEILKTLERFGIKSALFVCGKRVNSPAGRELLKKWDKKGHLICNHSYSHSYFHSNKISLEDYEKDMLRCDSLIKDHSNYTRLFRYPYLKEGNTLEKRDGFREFLSGLGYKNGSVTIDASDWYIDQRINDTLKENPNADLAPFREFYLLHIFERAVFYEELAFKLTGRHIKHTLLLHYNKLNMLFLGDLLAMFIEKGWKLVDAKNAFEDPVFSEVTDVLPAGESLIWGLAKQSGKYENILRYPGEDSEYEEGKLNSYLSSFKSK